MRKIFAILIVLSLLWVSGCRSPDVPKPPKSTATTKTVISKTAVSDTEKTDEAEAESSTVPDSEMKKAAEDTTAVTSVATETKKTETTNPTQAKQKESSPASIPQEWQSQDLSVPTETPKQNATATDSKIIAEGICNFINEYRLQQGGCKLELLTGLSEYAEYRSRQLISNFAHDTDDERAAAIALKYGMYVDPSIYGMTGDAYYTACAGEAIAKAGYTGTAESIARSFATLTKNSSSHWSYVGSNDYKYVGIGITYESGMWYCNIAVARENSDEK